MRAYIERERGVAGLEVLLSVIVILFVIGFVVMIFAMMGGELSNQTLDDTSGSVVNESTAAITEAGDFFPTAWDSGYYSPTCSVIAVINHSGIKDINSDNYTIDNCNIVYSNTEASEFNGTVWNISYTYTAKANSTATNTIYKTYAELGGVTDWFGIIIVITAMVVLILLTVIIISAIRGSGMIAGGGTSGGLGGGFSTTTA